MECTLGEIVASAVGGFQRWLKGPKANAGAILIRYVEEKAAKEKLTLHLSAQRLDRRGWCAPSADALLALYRTNEDGSHSVVHRTEVVKVCSPSFRSSQAPSKALPVAVGRGRRARAGSRSR